MASIAVVSTSANDRLSSGNHTTSSIISSSPNSGSSSPTTYLLLTTTSSETKPVMAKTTIAPKRSGHHLSANSGSQSSTSVLRAKRKIQFATGGERHSAPPAVARRNERERNRVRQVNMGFATLRQHVPNGTKSKKMSKVETLRSAVQYIKQLQELLDETGHSDNSDENRVPCFEDVAQLASSSSSSAHHLHHHRPHQHQSHHQSNQINDNLGLIGITSPQYSAASSPTPSLGSDASSPYGDSLSPEDEDLLDWCLNIW